MFNLETVEISEDAAKTLTVTLLGTENFYQVEAAMSPKVDLTDNGFGYNL